MSNQSFLLDMRIIISTIWKVLKREGVSHKQFATMPKFKEGKLKKKHDRFVDWEYPVVQEGTSYKI